MKRAVLLIIVLALCAAPALAGQNPHIQIFLYTTSTGLGGTNNTTTPAEGANKSVYVCFDHFGPLGDGVGGGMYAAQWQFLEVGGPSYMSTTNQFVAVGGLTIGTPGVAPGCAMITGPAPAYPVNGVVVLARIRYETPEPAGRVGGYIQIIDYSAGDGSVVADANNELDGWCVRSTVSNPEALSGNFYWDTMDPSFPDGDCADTPVEATSWGSIKAMYR